MRICLIIITIGIFLGCSDEECNIPYLAPQVSDSTVYISNINTIQGFLEDNDLQANSTASGLHYIIDDPGSEQKPDLCDQVNVSYVGYFSDGTVFDSSPDISFFLANVIPGWKEGIPLFGKGGNGMLLVPSHLAYGDDPFDPRIPPNSVLIFDVTLKDF